MNDSLGRARDTLMQGMSQISLFWGFPKGMGAIFGALYLSPGSLSLDDLVTQVGLTKSAVSANVRALQRLGLVHPVVQIGERKDYYAAETDFWKIARAILKEREQSEFDRALRSVGESLESVEQAQAGAALDPEEAGLAVFYHQRLSSMQSFFRTLDHLVETLLALDELRLSTIEKSLGKENVK